MRAEQAASVLFVALLFSASFCDVKKRIIPDTVSLLIFLTGFLNFEPVRLLGILAALPLFFAALFWGGVGGGDVKLMAAAGFVLGLQRGMAALCLGLAALLLYYAVYIIVQKLRGRKCQRAFPLAPFLSVGCIAIMMGGIIP